MTLSKYAAKIRRISLFRDLDDGQLSHLISNVREIHLTEGEFLLKEGDPSTDLFLIEDGSIEILKKNTSNGQEMVVCSLESGQIVGEMAFIRKGHREASARALKPTRLLAVSLHIEKNDPLYLELKSRVSDLLMERLKKENEIVIENISANLEHTKARSGLGNLIVHLVALIFLYVYATRIISILDVQVISSTIISVPILALFAISMFMLIKASGYPLSSYGFNWGSKGIVIESLILCIPLFAVVVITKWLVMNFLPAFYDLKFFHVSSGSDTSSTAALAILIGLYVLFVPIQEFIFRGAIQSSLEQFLLGKHRTLQAILISNLPFSMIHLHLSFSLAVLVYSYGVYWGWMYARQRTLIGCCINHFFVGIWAFFIVGIQDFLVV